MINIYLKGSKWKTLHIGSLNKLVHFFYEVSTVIWMGIIEQLLRIFAFRLGITVFTKLVGSLGCSNDRVGLWVDLVY